MELMFVWLLMIFGGFAYLAYKPIWIMLDPRQTRKVACIGMAASVFEAVLWWAM